MENKVKVIVEKVTTIKQFDYLIHLKILDRKDMEKLNKLRVTIKLERLDLEKNDVLEIKLSENQYNFKHLKIEDYKIVSRNSDAELAIILCKILNISKQSAQNISRSCEKNVFEKIINSKYLEHDFGIDKSEAEKIEENKNNLEEFYDLLNNIILLNLSFLEIFKMYERFQESTKAVLFSNPFVFIEEIGYDKALNIAKIVGFPLNSMEHAIALLINSLKEEAKNGNLYMDLDNLVEKMKEKELSIAMINKAIKHAYSKSLIYISKDGKVTLIQTYKTEKNTAALLEYKINNTNINIIDSKKVEEFISEFEESNSFSFSDEQKDAIRMFAKSPIFILTGGPGTGKTQTAKAIVELSKRFGYTLSLACPTGKASARLSEVVGEYSSTIHRALEIGYFFTEANREIQEDIVLIDEMSMVGSFLFYELIKNISDNSKIVFIGDVDQIESVEAGNILESLIDSGKIPTTRLKKVFRQAEGSKIVVNAHKIKNNDPNLEYGDDFKFVRKETDDEIMAHILKSYKYLREKLGYEAKDIAILSPTKKTSIGTHELNFQIQKHFNKSDDFIISPSGIKFSPDDRIMQNENNNEEGIYNGTTGSIAFINEKSVTLEFDDGAWVDYFKEEFFNTVIHSYASTIHKYQGSEVKVVIVPLSFADKNMWNKKLFYTALTRAKELFIMIGNEEIFKDYCMREPEKRRTLLKEFL
ncbi:putative DNA-binding protein [Acetoanaerobium sticklandii]|uniref:Putative DNA-binding protein n=1 Tax=Acetoanaerobium sticklandii (strain ATCC 12662 / DSM 519 / JCM 1433 / CCUG 9281 / NCIMB 10654 / HF) TaxID=499177 RepID=E3PY73_ACESD|nr:AAA family ATPase [Acetoanaerobium sticklandii]CBH21388.1 putative DNA-binding protein [Acetoanaerobium sticklandii]